MSNHALSDGLRMSIARQLVDSSRAYISALPNGTAVTDETTIAAVCAALSECDWLTDLVGRSAALVDMVSFDDNGSMVGKEWRGGNGGLLSRETTKAADAVRSLLLAEVAQ